MSIYDNRICRKCSCTFSGGPRAWYCPQCRAQREKERAQRYRNKGYTRRIGDIDTCQNCGAEYTISSGLQKYCPDCAEMMHKKIDNEQSKKYYNDNIKPDTTERKAKRHKYYNEHKDELNAKRRKKT